MPPSDANSPGQPVRPNSHRVIDMHVHIVGNGSGGTGCWVRSSPWRWPLMAFMLRHVGLPIKTLKGELDQLFVEVLLAMVRESSLDAVVILAHEKVYDEEGRCQSHLGTAYVPNDYVLELSRRHPEFLPAVSIHPARPDALEELERCLDAGAVMLKILPNCQNIDCNNRRYTRFWERMAEAGLPLLAHTGGEHTVQVVRPDLSDPRTLELPLQCGVKVIAAHCATRSGLFDRQYFPVLVELFRRYPNLYGDTSAFNVPRRGSVIRECLRPELLERMIHGSDFPVPVFGHWAWARGLVDWPAFRRCERLANVLERDVQLKRAMGFPPETFTRINGLLLVSAARKCD